MPFKKYSSEQLKSILISCIQKVQKEDSMSDGRFYRWITSDELSEKTGWPKRKVRYEYGKLVESGQIETHKRQVGAYRTYSVSEWEECVRFGDYFKPSN